MIYDTIRYEYMIWYKLRYEIYDIRYDMIRYDMIKYAKLWYDKIQYDIIR